jgi:4-hydroxythreonine-4-phosphate dehydrogenase
MEVTKPIVGITMGDPTGIGPEIAAKTLSKKEIYDLCNPIVVGDVDAMRQGIEIAGVGLEVRPIADVSEAKYELGTMDVFAQDTVDVDKMEHGKVSAMGGATAFEAVRKVIELAMDKKIAVTVTGPINKEALNKAGYHFSGHTEIYAHFTNTKDYAMLLIHGNLRVIHVTTHVSLRQACDLIKKKRILSVIELAENACRKFGVEKPRIGVAGLNPHSSDGGLFGDEEEKEIIPAIEEAVKKGILASGPVPADTLFSKAQGGRYDICVAMYHDQGHIPLKLVGFTWNEQERKWDSVSGVNITLGLPIIRTSVDHGTAFDRAGKGTAKPESLIQAIEYGVKLATNH